MSELLKGLVALVIICAVIRYAADRVVKRAIEVSEKDVEGYQLEFKPLEFPETSFEWNGNLSSDWNGGD